MTKINRITVHGFKSFAHKTDIPFENSFNCILGPNGSGKSNVGDAICFVLGRLSAKSMRAEKAANLIFNGGKKRKPAVSGSVEIEFCNEKGIFPTGDKSIVLNRTIKKSGSSVYKLNGKKHTRTEIVDLLGTARINPDGYNIILQGDITRFVTMSPVERRKIIEEISDVSIYEEKKGKALKELTKVEEQLSSAQIILKERKTYLKELQKDRDQALRFKALKGKIDSSKATFVHMRMQDELTKKKDFDTKHLAYEEKVLKSTEKIETLKNKIVEHKKIITSINNEIEQKGEKEQLQVHKQIEDLKIKLAQDRTRVSTLKDEINKIKQRKDQLKLESKDLDSKTSQLSKEQSSLRTNLAKQKHEQKQFEEKIAAFKKKNKIESSQELEGEIEKKDTIIEKMQEEVQKVRVAQQELLREKDKLEFQLETIDEKLAKVKAVSAEHKDQIKVLEKLKKDFKTATLKLNVCLDKDSKHASEISNARRELVDLQERHAKAHAKSASIAASLANNRAVSSILSQKRQFKGVYGTVGQLGNVPKEYSQALEVAAGGKMQHLIVDTDQTAAECIKYLKSNKLGSASFIPLNKIRFTQLKADDTKYHKINGVHDFAINIISYKSKFKNAFSYVFGRTLVVENVSTARRVGVGTIRMTTVDGNSIEASGVMRGGFTQRRSGSGFASSDALEAVEKLDSQVMDVQAVLSNIESKRSGNDQEISSLRTLKAELEGEIIKLEKSLHLDTGDLEATHSIKKELRVQLSDSDVKLREIRSSIAGLNKELAAAKSGKQILRSKVSALRNPRLLAQLQAFEESKQQCRNEITRIESDLRNSVNHSERLLQPERDKLAEIMKQHSKEEEDFTSEIKDRSSEIKNHEHELKNKEKASKEFYAKYKQLFNKREKVNSAVTSDENTIEQLREKSRGAERDLNLISLKGAEVKARLAGLEEEYSQYKGVELIKGQSIDELRREISKFEVMISQMSAVNMKALEVYEQVEEEYHKLVEKRESLSSEKTDVLTLMNEIETKKKEHFMKTYNHANDNFVRIFGNLFKKGKAYLQLENKAKPFDGGLEIKVKLTGNRFMDLKSLSGGEKTLTALSFIFAIQEYQPASFYILDEIDAALDKHNAETLAQLIRSYSDKAQYIVISHNDSVISEADTLFGVSMHEGASKVTGLKI